MRKIGVILCIILIMGMNTGLAYGNAGPVTWPQYPGISLITIDEGSPIKVLKENLHFDFSDEVAANFSVMGKVSAQYTMENANNENLVSRMVFPYIKNIWDRNEDYIDVLVDGEPKDYKIYYGKTVEKTSTNDQFSEKIELQEILKSINDKPYEPKNFDYSEKATLYRININADQVEDLNVEGYFTLNKSDSRILSKGNDRYGYDDATSEIMVGTWVNKETTTMEIFSFDEEIDIELKGFRYIESVKEEVKDFSYAIEEVEMDIITYYQDYLATEEVNYSDFYLPENKNLYYEALDQSLELDRFITLDHIHSYLSSPRYVLLAYEVPFEAFEEKMVEVRYHTLGSMDRSKTIVPTYTFEYFLHPAKYWKDFHNLTITITPSESYPYVVDSNLELTKESDGSYKGYFETLPDEDFSFTLYKNEVITPKDKMEGFMFRHQYFFIFIGIPVLIAVFIIILGVSSYKYVKSKKI